MSLRQDVRYGLRIGRAEFIRSLRRYLGNPRRVFGLLITALVFGGALLFALPAAYVLGQTARSVTAIPFFAPAVTLATLGLFSTSVFRTLERLGHIDASEFVLLAVHPRAVVIGLITAEMGRLSLWFGIPVGAVVITFAFGLGAPLLVASGGVVALPLICCVAVWGHAAGIAVLRLLRQAPRLRRLLKPVGIFAMVGLVVASQLAGQLLVESDISARPLFSTFAFDPLVEYVGLTFVGTPVSQPISLAAVGVLAALIALIPIGLAVSTKQVSTLWFTDPVDENTSTQVRRSSGGFSVPRPFAWTKAGRIAWGILVRARRDPAELSHLLIVVFFIAPFGTLLVEFSADAIGPLIAGAGVVLAPYLSGATFGLNPLGDERPQLPLLLLIEAPAATLVRGRLLAGIAIGAPVALVGSLVSIGFGMTVPQASVTAAVGATMCLTAAMFAVGIGSAYPIYEERKFWGTETVVPSTLVMMVFLFVVGGGTVLGLFVTWFALTGNIVLTPVFNVFFGTYLLLTVGVSYGSYRYALRRHRRYTLA
ncbi:hypothetical protein C464_17012 [Halorubrum coriense DSM 10284]|uniref:ABC-2 type transport system permease protein n=1 Tax=Halorubrum coriense DSM 10284 TaxID=1227466 RepID=M0E995_9EURY|nr:hypothetical protein [Halorubrum coriense]ELZ43447.1 hypothetical protein C464_17012 [Halorubrum coriense DSM 10284]